LTPQSRRGPKKAALMPGLSAAVVRPTAGSLPTVSADALAWRGSGLMRPECVLATASGDLYTADWRGGVAQIRADGSQTLYTGRLPQDSTGNRPTRPNGIALRRNGNFLMADLGEDFGGVFELSRDGVVRDVLTQVDGLDLPPSNFVTEDAQGRIWLTVSTRLKPRALAYTSHVADGFIVLIDDQGARIVADGIGFTNEALVSPDGKWLYVNETYHKKMSRYPLRADGSLGPKEVFTTFGHGAFPDGFAFDTAGGIWVACVIGNQLIRVAQDGSQQVILDDGNPEYVDWVEAAYAKSELGRQHMDKPHTTRLKNISSIAFGGPDLKTVYLGCLVGDSIAHFRLPDELDLAGHPPVHWNY
jgi:sugar lactone lactonase YvrE